MADTPFFSDRLTSEEELRQLYGFPSERAVLKQRASLDEHGRAFIAASPFLIMGTANAAGECDVSPKGDPPGFVVVLDDRHLVVPDRPGNKRLDGLRNILANGHIALIFFVPGRNDTLRVNGRACLVRDVDLLERLAVDGKRPTTAIGVEIEEVFMHCPRALLRSVLWAAAQEGPSETVASFAKILWDQVPSARPTDDYDEYVRKQQEGLKTLY
jgi:PPOX class probable FMN-dependent enzyme